MGAMEKAVITGSVAYRLEDGTPVPYLQYQFDFMGEPEPLPTGTPPVDEESSD